MALILCPECNREISDKALSCPNCGCPFDKKTTLFSENNSNESGNSNNNEAEPTLSEKQLTILSMEMARKQKSVGLTYILWFFLGQLGVHKFYMGKYGMGVLQLILGCISWVCLIGAIITEQFDTGPYLVIGLLPLIAFIIFAFYDLFTIPRQVAEINERIKADEIEKLSLHK